MCFCNHRYKYHDYNNVNNIKKIKCKKCPCKCYDHIPCYGANDVKCLCHHSYRVHDLFFRNCKKRNCKCQKFNSKFTCNCGEGYDTHKTYIYTREERIKNGKPVEIGWFGGSLLNNKGGGGIQLENYGQIMNDIYDTEFKNMEKKYDGRKIMYKSGIPIESFNGINQKRNNLDYNSISIGEKNISNIKDDYSGNNYKSKSKDNLTRLKNMTYEEVFGLNKKAYINKDFENDNNNMKKYGGFIMNNKDNLYNNKNQYIYNYDVRIYNKSYVNSEIKDKKFVNYNNYNKNIYNQNFNKDNYMNNNYNSKNFSY